MRILGIDPGTNRTGWGMILHEVSDNSLPAIKYIDHGCIVTEQVDLMERRLFLLHRALNEIIKLNSPDCLIIEHIFFGRNAKTAISVSQARGVIMLSAANYGLPIFEYTPMTVKLSLSGSGKTDKKDIQKIVRRILNTNSRKLAFNGKDKDFDDSADALAIAIHHVIRDKTKVAKPRPKKKSTKNVQDVKKEKASKRVKKTKKVKEIKK